MAEQLAESHSAEVDSGKRFQFGKNWSRFLELLDDKRIEGAVASLQNMLGVEALAGRTFLDVGSGSGLFSLAARRLGARVHSFDYDPQSVACTAELRNRYFPHHDGWDVEGGSILDSTYLAGLSRYDVVYSWGVLHHTGEMWRAIENASRLVRPGGLFFIALYNDQRWISSYWKLVKKIYVASALARGPLVALHAPYLIGGRWLVRRVLRKGEVPRGMAMWRDMIDWIGGYPFEVAKPSDVVQWCRSRGYTIRKMVTCGRRHGCNEFVFSRDA
jgi:2-polyprenyl-6-hydroxyphenyl methylase/3-demethylubiquinone-9 3-methyltransferase